MDLDKLESFVAVARLGSFTKAAKERHLTQPGVSRHVQRLERELEVILLERRRGAVEPTSAGHRLLSYAQDALGRNLRFVAELRKEVISLSGELRVAASTTPGEFLVPGWVAGFTKLHSAVRPQVFVADSAEVISELREHRWDVGFVGSRISGRDLLYEEIAEDEVVLAVPLSHPFAKRKEVALEELEDQPFLEREGGSGTLSSFRGALSYRGLALPQYQVVMVLNSTQAILSAVRSGHGLGLVSILALEHQNQREIVPVRLKELPRNRPLYMVRDRRRPLPVVTAFAEWVKAQWSATPRNGLHLR
jgi:DNA-binding transcriptional LysR family regulator